MGAPKQKWTAEEEAALKAGILKHGSGKWRTILKDPKFSKVLWLRSNVDLKDKWRNMNVTSREKARLAFKKGKLISKNDQNPLALTNFAENVEDEIFDVKPLAVSTENIQIIGQERSITGLDTLIFEAITNLKEPSGSNKTAIAMYIEDQYWPPPDLKCLLSEKLKELTASKRLIKVKRKYRIAPISACSVATSSKAILDGRKKEPSRTQRNDFKPLSRAQVDADLIRMRNMTSQEAAAAAALAVAEAEAAMAEAEQAAREAEAAEADAEAAQAFAEAAMLTLKNKTAARQMIRV